MTLFLQSAFEIANDNECPESWLFYAGIVKLVCGPAAHRRWHYTGPAGQPRRFVRWYCRSVDAPKPETIINLWHSLVAWLTRSKPPWTIEAEEEAEEAAAEAAADAAADEGSAHGDAPQEARGPDAYSVASAQELRLTKRMLTVFGVGGVYLVWAIFSWFIFVRPRMRCAACARHVCSRACALQAYGMLIFKLLGDQAQQQFAKSWGVSYGACATCCGSGGVGG